VIVAVAGLPPGGVGGVGVVGVELPPPHAAAVRAMTTAAARPEVIEVRIRRISSLG
jgi:hypothetical protein